MTELFDDVTTVVDALHGDVDPNLVYSKLETYQNLADRVARVIQELSVGFVQSHPPFIDLTENSDDDDEVSSVLPCSSGTLREESVYADAIVSNSLPEVAEGCNEAVRETTERDETCVDTVIPLSSNEKCCQESLPSTLELQTLSAVEVQNAAEHLASTSDSIQCFLDPSPSTSRSEDPFLKPLPLASKSSTGPSCFTPQTSTSSLEATIDSTTDVMEEPLDLALSWIDEVRAKQEAMKQVLLHEARSLFAILHRHTLGEIYAFLEYHMDDENRFQIVLEHFQHQDAVSEAPVLVVEEEEQQPPPLTAEEGMDTDKCKVGNKPIPENEKQMLLGMFPDMDPEYLAEIPYEDRADWLNDTISHLLQTDYRRRTVTVEEDRPMSPASRETQYQYLVAILPNADPTYLRQQCEMMGGNREAMKEFVAQAMEYHNYPTLKEYLKRREIQELQEKYTKEFKVEEFLEIFPNPTKYFFEEKKNNKDVYPLAMSYLKKRYPRLRLTDIQTVYRKSDFSLTRACKSLDSFPYKMKTKRTQIYDSQAPTVPNIPFMQEVAFIENQSRIQEYLTEKAAAKKAAFEQAQAAGLLMECGCCFAGDVLVEDMAACEAGHLFCKECVLRGTETQIGDGKTTFPCFSDCTSEFSLKTLKDILKPSVFSRLLHRKQIEEVKAAGIPGLETCQFCDFATIPAPEDKVFHCLNPECMKNTCRLCKEPDHLPLRCDEVEHIEEVRMRTYIENRMTEALVRTCWKCKQQFIKEDGCNKMRCTCGALMCYICRQPVSDYSHFNPMGGTEFDKCPLFSTNEELHVTAVKEEAKKAKKEVLNMNPGRKLKSDPTTVLSEPSRKQAKSTARDNLQNLVRVAAAAAMPRHGHHRHRPMRVQRFHHMAMGVRPLGGRVQTPPRAVNPIALQRLVYGLGTVVKTYLRKKEI
ncbi:uncharacterized protein [Anabrus simplex]|uniref:uncharacterized protein isoform X2 n=1 Tax=Anabrus simplex TaxID=316456 RepID=UPI0035A31965